jgi:hypothetical protein
MSEMLRVSESLRAVALRDSLPFDFAQDERQQGKTSEEFMANDFPRAALRLRSG